MTGVVLLFVALAAVMTWPQAIHLTTHARDHHDVYFNMWRLAWAAHAFATGPRHLFDGNMFFPEIRTLTLSDAMFVEALLAAPLLWIGLPQVLVHNLLLLGGIVASAVGAFVLARHLTGCTSAAITAGIVFAFAPYRFEHYMHLELQWAMWAPWALWALHRTFETGSRGMGVLTGVFVALQTMSSIYYGIFLMVLLSLCAGLLMLSSGRAGVMRVTVPLAAGAFTAAVACGAYAVPYLATRGEVGGRSEDEIRVYSATPANYRVATPDNLLYGARSGRLLGRPERRLFPGVVPLLLGVMAFMLRRPSRDAIVYVLCAVAAFDMSLGFGGISYRFLYEHVPLFGGLRAPARLGIFVLLFLGVVAALGQAAIFEEVPQRGRRVAAVIIPSLVLLEYWVAPIQLTTFPSAPPPLYAWLAAQPHGVVAEFPMPSPNTLPGREARYLYMSTFHWKPIVNGYSGYYPQSYIARLEQLSRFPDIESLERLHREEVRYLIVHTASYPRDEAELVLSGISASGAARELGHFDDGEGTAVVFGLR